VAAVLRPDPDATGVKSLGVPTDVETAERATSPLRVVEMARRSPNRLDAQLRSVADEMPLLMWSARSDGYIDWYNKGWYQYTGQTPEEAAGWGWQAVHHPDDLPRVMQRWPHSIATGEPFEFEFRLRRNDGAFRWFLTRATPVRDAAGQVERWYGTNTDIHDEHTAADQLQLDVYGEVLDSAWLFVLNGGKVWPELWTELAGVVDLAASNWKKDDASIWEVRGVNLPFTYSKAMCWAALDRGIRMARRLRFPWLLAGALIVIPRPIRDWAYDRLARRRYRWFGRRESCMVPTPEIRSGFVD